MYRVKVQVEVRKVPVVNPRMVQRVIRRIVPQLQHQQDAYFSLFATEQANTLLNLPHFHREVSDLIQRLVNLLDLPSFRTPTVYLLEPEWLTGLRLKEPIHRVGSCILVDITCLAFLNDGGKLCDAVKREVVRLLFAPVLSDYPPIIEGVSEYLSRQEGNGFWNEAAAYLKVFPLPTIVSVITGEMNRVVDGILLSFIDNRVGMAELLRFIKDKKRRFVGLFVAVPTIEWVLESVFHCSLGDLEDEWSRFVAERCGALDQETLRLYGDKFQVKSLYDQNRLSECTSLCKKVLASHPSDPEMVFYLVGAVARLREYQEAVEVLSQNLPFLSGFHLGWAHLRLGQLYDLLRERDSAVYHYTLAVTYSDPWRLIARKAERWLQESFSLEGVASEEWVHFQEGRVKAIVSDWRPSWAVREEERYLLKVRYALTEHGHQ
jgi:tetratricopeptide (TPR) repeat protein